MAAKQAWVAAGSQALQAFNVKLRFQKSAPSPLASKRSVARVGKSSIRN